ncbi:amidohydrolase family protein [Salinicola rhizosphaerae]|uniref:Cytosine deaminase n=1 Tax=Salinicola rhizosphaerae TaxID=1443141 RepID=A0ABQ3E2U9_9GAMM|nr:amidohydrolase family protein [Salinicola rhizosphaerae]GHB22988.1 cytosine deaminase [Salinicola rhizosphaerae]
MPNPPHLSRRQILAGMAAGTGSLALGGPLASASASAAEPPRGLGPVWKIEQATIITMDDASNDLTRGDILVRNGVIEQIAPQIDAPDAEIIDGRHRIAFPGLIDAHNHMWQTQMRGMFGQRPGNLFFPLTRELDDAFRPEDVAISEQMSAFENAASGITTSNDFFDNNRSPEYAEAALNALAGSPIRTRLLYGNRSKTATDGIDLEHLGRLQDSWGQRAGRDRLMLGMAWRLPKNLEDEAAMTMKRREFEFARERGLPTAVHVSGEQHHAMFQALIDGGYLYPGLQVIHATDAKAAHLQALKDSGASLALSPLTEHRVAYGLTRYSHFVDVPRLGLGIDGNGLAGSADMFDTMRLMAMTEIGASHDQTAIDTRRLFSMATSGAAESMGISDRVGSLTPGKQADIAMVDTRALNLGMTGDDPVTLLIFCAKPENVEFVSVGGRAVKREGQLLDLNLDQMLGQVARSIEHLQQARRALAS